MQNNEFEKQVQERMGQIKFTPSEAVWAEVEKNLRQRRKRRIAIFWLFIFFIAAGGTSLGWFYLSPSDNRISNHQSKSASALKNTTAIPPVQNSDDQSSASSSGRKENSVINESPKTGSSLETSAEKINQGSRNNSGANSQKNTPHGQLTPIQKNKNVSTNSAVNIETSGSKINKTRDKKSAAALTTPALVDANIHGDMANTTADQPDKAVAVNENKVSADSSVTNNDSSVNLVKINAVDSQATATSTVKIKNNAKSKWQFGVSVGVGMSDIVHPASMNKSLDMAMANPSNPPSSNLSAPGNSFQNAAIYISPKELNPGIEFSLGFSASKKLKKRWSVAIGLQYHYYSTSIKVGPYLDSSRSYLAAGPRVNDHTNKYHFVEIPVTLGFQLLKNKPLLLTSGISLAQLIVSDVLTYNSAQRVFISDGSNLNKTQLNILLGLSWTFGDKGRMPIQVGPNFSYGASNLSGKSISGSNHMYTVGAGAKIMFRKK